MRTAFLVLACTASEFWCSAAMAQCTLQWLPGQGMLGVNDVANAVITFDNGTGPAVYVGGNFTVAGSTADSFGQGTCGQFVPTIKHSGLPGLRAASHFNAASTQSSS